MCGAVSYTHLTCVNNRQVQLCKSGWKISHIFLRIVREPKVTRISDICEYLSLIHISCWMYSWRLNILQSYLIFLFLNLSQRLRRFTFSRNFISWASTRLTVDASRSHTGKGIINNTITNSSCHCFILWHWDRIITAKINNKIQSWQTKFLQGKKCIWGLTEWKSRLLQPTKCKKNVMTKIK